MLNTYHYNPGHHAVMLMFFYHIDYLFVSNHSSLMHISYVWFIILLLKLYLLTLVFSGNCKAAGNESKRGGYCCVNPIK